MTRKRFSGVNSPALTPPKKKQMRKGVGKLKAPIVMHLKRRKRFFNTAKYLLRRLPTSMRCSRGGFDFGMIFSTQARRRARNFGVFPLVLFFLTLGYLQAAPVSKAPPANPYPADLGAYIVAHQAALGPYFSSKGQGLLSEAAPLLLEMAGRSLLLGFLVGWCLDVLLARGFAILFAPASVGYKPAFAFATGILVLNVFVAALLVAGIARIAGSSQFNWMITLLFATAIFVAYVFQVAWICYRFQTAIPLSSLFFLTLFVTQTFALLGTSAIFLRAPADSTAIYFMNEVVAGDMEAEVRSIRSSAHQEAETDRQVADQAENLQDQVKANRAEMDQLKKEITAAKESEPYLYSRIVKLHAQGSLAAARDQFAALLLRFPGGTINGEVQGQLTQVSSEISAQEQQTNQERAAHLQDLSHARADLLARAREGKVTLSEIRKVLFGMTRLQVSGLFGPPSETGADRWGFDRLMIFNPLTNEKSGLAVYFNDGSVQSVDYYYGVKSR